MYFVIGNDGQKYGPVDINGLKQWVTEGRVNASTVLEAQISGQRIQASTLSELGLNSTPGAAPTGFTPPGYGPVGAPSYSGGSAKSSGGGAKAALGIILALIIVAGAIGAFLYFKKPAIVGSWTCDLAPVLNQGPGAARSGLRFSSAMATFKFEKDGSYSCEVSGQITNGRRSAPMAATEKGTYKMQGDTGTATATDESFTIMGQEMPMDKSDLSYYTIKLSGDELTMTDTKNSLSVKMTRQKQK